MTNLQALYTSERPVAVMYPSFSVNCYGVIRGLGERGIQVLALDDVPNPNWASRYCTPMACPSPKTEPDRFAAFLAELGGRFRTRPVLFMMEDLYVYLAHRYRTLLEPVFRFPFMPESVLLDCIDKQRTFEVAEREGVALPPTWYPETRGELEALKPTLRFPVILKPLVSRFDFSGDRVDKICTFPQHFQSKAVQADDWEALVAQFETVGAMGIRCCVQELIPGEQDALYGSTMYVDGAGEVLGIFVRTKLRQTPWDFGTMTLGRAAASPEVVEISKRMVRALGFRGICGMEFKRDARDGTYRFLEINPRGELWMNLANHCGVNLPYLKYQDLIGEPLRATQTDFSRRLIDVRDDFGLYYWKYRHDHGQPHHIGLGAWVASLFHPHMEEVIFNWRDPAPGLLRYAHYARDVAQRHLTASKPPAPAIAT